MLAVVHRVLQPVEAVVQVVALAHGLCIRDVGLHIPSVQQLQRISGLGLVLVVVAVGVGVVVAQFVAASQCVVGALQAKVLGRLLVSVVDSEVQHESIAPVELMVIVQAACHVQLPVFVQSVVQRAVDERAAQGAVLTAGTAVAIGVVYIDGAPQRERLFHLEPAVGIETEILLSDPRL